MIIWAAGIAGLLIMWQIEYELDTDFNSEEKNIRSSIKKSVFSCPLGCIPNMHWLHHIISIHIFLHYPVIGINVYSSLMEFW